MNRLHKIVVAAALSLLFSGTNVAHGQTANQWYPTQDPGMTVAAVWYLPVTNSVGIPPHIGVQTESRASYFYYFSPTDTNQLAVAHAIYASLLSAQISGQPVFLYMSGADQNPSAGGVWDFTAVQVGNNP